MRAATSIASNTSAAAGPRPRDLVGAIVAPPIVPRDDLPHALVQRVCAGEPAALAELYDAHAAPLLAFARRLVGEPSAAEDLVHEVFMAAPRVLVRFQGQASLRTFLTAVAINHARHHVRSAARRRAASDRLAREPEGEVRTPEEAVHREHLARALNEALDALPLDQRVAFVLCEVEGRTSREAAELVDAPEATVRTRLFHAKRKLRATLTERGIR
jgi:RNA polymerase sigma-70 factor, ECF subfamily